MSRPQPIPFRPLGILTTALESLGHRVTHCYEDLVFIEHNAFLLRMEEKGEQVSLFFNAVSAPDQRPAIATALAEAGRNHRLAITCLGTYRMTQNDGENSLSLEFLENQ